jgi:hypothetical protein
VNDRQVIFGNYQYIGVSLIFVIWYGYIVDMHCLESMTALFVIHKGKRLAYFLCSMDIIWATSWQNQHSGFETSMDPDQPAHLGFLIRIHAVRLQTLLQVEKLIANSMDPDQTARMRRLVWIHAGRKPTMLVLSWRSSYLLIRENVIIHESFLLY